MARNGQNLVRVNFHSNVMPVAHNLRFALHPYRILSRIWHMTMEHFEHSLYMYAFRFDVVYEPDTSFLRAIEREHVFVRKPK